MTNDLKEFLERNISLIENNNFNELYLRCFSFDMMSELTNVLLDSDIDPLPHMTQMGDSMYKAVHIERLIIPSNINVIQRGAVQDCEKLTKVVIPDTVSYIGNLAFDNCPNLYHVVYKGTKEQFLKIHFYAYSFVNNALECIHCSDGDLFFKDHPGTIKWS